MKHEDSQLLWLHLYYIWWVPEIKWQGNLTYWHFGYANNIMHYLFGEFVSPLLWPLCFLISNKKMYEDLLWQQESWMPSLLVSRSTAITSESLSKSAIRKQCVFFFSSPPWIFGGFISVIINSLLFLLRTLLMRICLLGIKHLEAKILLEEWVWELTGVRK